MIPGTVDVTAGFSSISVTGAHWHEQPGARQALCR